MVGTCWEEEEDQGFSQSPIFLHQGGSRLVTEVYDGLRLMDAFVVCCVDERERRNQSS